MKYHLLPLLIIPFLFSCNETGQKTDDPKKPAKDSIIVDTKTACIFAEIAYCSDPAAQLEKHLPNWKIVWNPAAVGGNHALVATDGNNYALAFRGSLISFTEDAFNNWVYNDLNVATQIKWPYSKNDKTSISQGSYIGWQNLEKMKDKTSGKTLWSFLSENINDEKALILTGHSLGGNLAAVYASYLWFKFNESGHTKNNINVITFAAPAPGNKSFADDFDTKFPHSERIENSNDIVPKFPCSKKMIELAGLYSPNPSAAEISVGYKNVTTKLSRVFSLVSTALDLLELRSDFYGYTHTNGDGRILNIALSGKNTSNSAANWFAEAGYQHSMAQYAIAFGAPVIACE